MTIDSIMRRAARQAADDGPDPLRGPEHNQDPSSIVATLAAHIPAEALAVYLAGLAFLVPDDKVAHAQNYTSRWILAGVVTVLAVLYALDAYRRELKEAGGTSFDWPWGKLCVVVVAFLAWVCVVPGSPFNSFSWYKPGLGAVIGIVVNALITVIVRLREIPS